MESRIESFTAYESLSLENSFVTIKEQKDIQLNVTIGIHDDESGWFELYDEESGGEEWYAEGGLELDGLSVTGYDGVFALPVCIINKLQEMGFDTTEIE
jgi:hypothetical protein